VTFATAASGLNSACLATFGEAATLRTAGGSDQALTAVISRSAIPYDMINIREITAQCLSSEYGESDYRRGDRLIVDGVSYSIGAARDDGFGMTTLELER
jgi:hypothetical protein